MEQKILLTWHGQDGKYRPKKSSWYWAIGIASGCIALAAIIIHNYLFAFIAILTGFTTMVIGSKRPSRHIYRLTNQGLVIGNMSIPFKKIQRFAIREAEPQTLVIETTSFTTGIVSVPLQETDWRQVKMEFKNHNIEEVPSLGSLLERVEQTLGL